MDIILTYPIQKETFKVALKTLDDLWAYAFTTDRHEDAVYYKGMSDMLTIVCKGNGLELHRDEHGYHYMKETKTYDISVAKNTTTMVEE